MISVDEALKNIIKDIKVLQPVEVGLMDSLGLVLAEDVHSPIDIPIFDNSAMDGYALIDTDITNATKESPVVLEVIADLAAGYVSEKNITNGKAIRIMTGAPVPDGANAVIMVEKTKKENGKVKIFQPVKKHENIRFAGEDVKKNELVLSEGKVLRAADIGLLASIGKIKVKTYPKPKVAIISTGDELIEIDKPLLPGKIRNSNAYSLASLVYENGGIPIILGIAKDTAEQVSAKVKEGLKVADILVTSGGVSVGDYDMVKNVLNSLGEMLFWKVAMKPAKPLAFGMIDGKPMFGLPGNPTSSMVSFEQFVMPAILKMGGRKKITRQKIKAILTDDIKKKPGRRNFVRVDLTCRGNTYFASLSGGQGSGMLKSMTRAQGLLILPEDTENAKSGEVYDVQVLYPEDVRHSNKSRSTMDKNKLAEVIKENQRDMILNCAEALKLANTSGENPKEIGEIANELDIKIRNCMLGCFK